MNTIDVAEPSVLHPTTAPTRLIGLTAAAFTVATAATLWGAHDRGEIAIVLGALIAATALIYGVLLPAKLRRPSPTIALTLSVIGILSILPAFWSGLPLMLGVAGAVLGRVAHQAGLRTTMSVVATVVGLLSILGYLAFYIDELITLGFNWWD